MSSLLRLDQLRSASRRSSPAARSSRTATAPLAPLRALLAAPVLEVTNRLRAAVLRPLRLLPSIRRKIRQFHNVFLGLLLPLESLQRRASLPGAGIAPEKTRSEALLAVREDAG